MNNIPAKLRKQLASDPEYKVCARAGIGDHVCDGRITWEHAMIYAGKQIQKRWAIIPLCAKAHSVDGWQDGGDLNKEVNEWIALNRASDLELQEVSKAINYMNRRYYLNQKYGPYKAKTVEKSVENPVDIVGKTGGESVGINYGILDQKPLFTF